MESLVHPCHIRRAHGSGSRFGHYPLPLALGWLSYSSESPCVLRLHLMLVEARNVAQEGTPHEVYPGGRFTGLLWAYALDNQRRAIFEVRPDPGMPG